mmetsp:Transcript_6008/g.11372  ORF Transcript_6008/g.11372 Transcript_6008/m.11372 type:complete len:247 (+) Transcript_6008:2746-3486(+)
MMVMFIFLDALMFFSSLVFLFLVIVIVQGIKILGCKGRWRFGQYFIQGAIMLYLHHCRTSFFVFIVVILSFFFLDFHQFSSPRIIIIIIIILVLIQPWYEYTYLCNFQIISTSQMKCNVSCCGGCRIILLLLFLLPIPIHIPIRIRIPICTTIIIIRNMRKVNDSLSTITPRMTNMMVYKMQRGHLMMYMNLIDCGERDIATATAIATAAGIITSAATTTTTTNITTRKSSNSRSNRKRFRRIFRP